MKSLEKSETSGALSGKLLGFFLLCGIVLRLIWVSDMEYKLDEMYMFQHVSAYLDGRESFPALGMPSGAQVKNPGMSIWVFIALGKIFGTRDATGLCYGVMLLNCLALVFFTWFALKEVERTERDAWLLGIANLAVNPLAIHLHRKIWAQSVLPIFCFLYFWAWWGRSNKNRAFLLGLIGAVLGQIHMSGFFMAAGFALWALLFERFSAENVKTHWKAWFLGSAIGALGLIPWLQYLLGAGRGDVRPFELGLATEFRFWVFWMAEPLGFHLGNILGVKLGEGFFTQNSQFFQYPGSSFLVGIFHAIKAVCALAIAWIAGTYAWKNCKRWKQILMGSASQTAFSIQAALIAFGNWVNLSGTVVRRYYVVVATPLPEVWLSRLALLSPKKGPIILRILIWAQLATSIAMLAYIHGKGGAPEGDYGKSYRVRGPEFP